MVFGVIILICVFFCCVSYFRYRNLSNPYSSFNILWIVVSVLILVGNKYVDTPSVTSSTCMLVGILGFNLSIYSKRLTLGKQTRSHIEYCINVNLLYVLSCIVVLVMISDATIAIKNVIAGVSFSQIRHDFFGFDTVASYYIKNLFVLPMGYAVVAAAVMSFFSPEKEKKIALVINAGMIVLFQTVTSGGRYMLMNTLFMIACGYMLSKERKKVGLKYKLLIAVLCFCLGYFIVYLTENRSSYIMTNMSIWQKMYTTIYLYFAGSVTYLGKVLEVSPEVIASTFGVNLIAGFVSPIFAALNFLHILPYPHVFSVIGTKACVQLQIGPNSFYNAMPTIFGYFFIDGGYFSTFIEAWIFGYVAKRTFIGAVKNDDLFVISYLLVFVQVCISSTRWMIYSPEFALAFLYVRLICKRRNINNQPTGV